MARLGLVRGKRIQETGERLGLAGGKRIQETIAIAPTQKNYNLINGGLINTGRINSGLVR